MELSTSEGVARVGFRHVDTVGSEVRNLYRDHFTGISLVRKVNFRLPFFSRARR